MLSVILLTVWSCYFIGDLHNGRVQELLNGGDSGEHVQEFGTEPNNFQQTPIVNSTPVSKASQKTKSKNFGVEEDRLLTSAWLNVSTDPKQGTNQTKATF
jgi:hypothetical protein